MKTLMSCIVLLCLSVPALGQVPGKYADHYSSVQRMINSECTKAINEAQRELTALDTVSAKLSADSVELSEAAKDHATKNQSREQAWQRVIAAINAGMGMDPSTLEYASHMAGVQALIVEAQSTIAEAEAARKRLVTAQEAVAADQAALGTAQAEHAKKNQIRIDVWRQVINAIELGIR